MLHAIIANMEQITITKQDDKLRVEVKIEGKIHVAESAFDQSISADETLPLMILENSLLGIYDLYRGEKEGFEQLLQSLKSQKQDALDAGDTELAESLQKDIEVLQNQLSQ